MADRDPHLMTWKSSLSVGIALIGLTLITVLYVGTSTDNFYADVKKLHVYRAFRALDAPPVRICCLILTSPKNFLTRAKAVNATWGPRCDQYYFITELLNDSLTAEQMNISKQLPIAPIKKISRGYDHLTQKSTLAFLFAYEQHINDFDWFVKADDDTYLIIDHLKAFLSEQNSSEPVTFGYNFKVIVSKGYHSGGASYVLSRESLRRFHGAHLDPASRCLKDSGAEDVEIAKCLRTKGVYPGKSLDKNNREIFHPLPFISHFLEQIPDWLRSYAENAPQSSYNCCSDRSVSFHYISPEEQHLMDFLLYRLRSPSSHTSPPPSQLTSIVKLVE